MPINKIGLLTALVTANRGDVSSSDKSEALVLGALGGSPIAGFLAGDRAVLKSELDEARDENRFIRNQVIQDEQEEAQVSFQNQVREMVRAEINRMAGDGHAGEAEVITDAGMPAGLAEELVKHVAEVYDALGRNEKGRITTEFKDLSNALKACRDAVRSENPNPEPVAETAQVKSGV